MALLLVITGLAPGALFTGHSSAIQESGAFAESALIHQAQGAEIDSAAVTAADAPFVASADAIGVTNPLENASAIYTAGAVKDIGAFAGTPVAQKTGSSAKKSLTYGVVYQINAGDTLSSIASEFGVSENRITQFNPSVNFSALTPGVSIIVPGANDVSPFSS